MSRLAKRAAISQNAGVPDVEVVQSNAGDPGAVKALVEQVRDKHGRIDVLFVNAGIGRLAALEDVEESLFDEIFNTNLRGPYFLLKHAAPVLSQGASVILTSSTAAVLGMRGLWSKQSGPAVAWN